MEEHLSNPTQRFVVKGKLFESNGVLKPNTQLVALSANKKANLKSTWLFEIGTKARALFASNLLSKIHLEKKCQSFYGEVVTCHLMHCFLSIYNIFTQK